MIKYREILRLASLGVSQRNIALSCDCARSTVQSALIRAKHCGLEWPLPEELDDRAIRALLFPPANANPANKAEIDHQYLEKELQHRGVTMMLLWREYCDSALIRGKEPFQYSAFCERHRKWKIANNHTMHIERKPAEQIQVDWAGDTMNVIDPDSGEVLKVYIFVASLPYSNYLYAEGFYSMKEPDWITAHVHAFSYFGGVTPILVPDNCKTGVIKHTINELILNDQYRRMAEYYGCAVVPARPRKPKDKASVEMSVNLVERQAIAALRNRRFLSLTDLNRALISRIEAINARPFQKREGSRISIFTDQEKENLIPLPARPYEIVIRKRVTVNFNYHICFEGIWYSVPFSYVKREVEVQANTRSVAIYGDGKRIAMHKRVYSPKGSYSTNPEHMPDAHRDYLEWNGNRFRRWADTIGPSTRHVIDAILSSRKIEQQTYRSCRALLALGQSRGNKLLEEACAKASLYSARPSYKSVKAILSTLEETSETNDIEHAYLRGADYYKNL